MCKVTITSQSCGCADYNELRVAFGDLNNCQLKCPFCFTLEQKPSLDELSYLSKSISNNVRFIRFTGGEPLYHQEQIDGIVRELREIERRNFNNLDLIIIQTNAIAIESRNIDRLLEFKLPILFEVSFKGTNVKEIQHLAFQNPIDYDAAKAFFYKQLNGYKIISNKIDSLKNIAVLARLGIFHSSIKQPTFKFIYPDTRELMFNPNNWDSEIKNTLLDQNRIWGNIFERRFVVEKIKTPADGSPGIGRRYREIIEQLKRKGLMEESKSILQDIYQKCYLYKQGYEIYIRAANNLRG